MPETTIRVVGKAKRPGMIEVDAGGHMVSVFVQDFEERAEKTDMKGPDRPNVL